jgi:hypothetical protein
MQGSSGTKLPRREKPAALLTKNMEKKLLAYAAAGAAGLAAVALPATGEVVYTASNTPIFANQGATNLDLNGDGIVDFTFNNFGTNNSRGGTYSVFLAAHPAQPSNQIFSFVSNGKVTAAALDDGFKIGPGGKFQSNPNGLNLFGYSNRGRGSYGGDWGKIEYGYVGLKFMINGEVHYGWARIKYPDPGDHTRPSIFGYAYETVANQLIVAGATSGTDRNSAPVPVAAHAANGANLTLGLLATGAPGIDILRKHGLAQTGTNAAEGSNVNE